MLAQPTNWLHRRAGGLLSEREDPGIPQRQPA